MPIQFPQLSDRAVVGIMFHELEAAANRSWVGRIAQQTTSDQDVETYAGAGVVPAMREWTGGKHVKNVRELSHTITNKDWESTIGLSKKDLRRDKTAQLITKASELAERAVEHEAKLLSDLMNAAEAGTLGLAYDGQFYFDTDHSIGNSGTMSNDVNSDISALGANVHGTVANPSIEEFALAILDAIETMYGFKDDEGEPANQNDRSFVVMVPTNYWGVAMSAVTKNSLFGGAENPLTGSGLNLSVVQNPRLTWTTKFAVYAADAPVRPFISQIEMGPLIEILGEGSDFAFFNKEHLFSVVKSGNVGFHQFTKAVLTTLI